MKIKNCIPVILCSIALCSCSDADKNIAFGLDSDAIKAEAAGGSHKIKVSASGDWVATTDEPWISISPANGRGTTECRILIDSALTDSPRRGVVRIQEQNTWDKKEITIDQQGFDYAITLGEKEVSVANFSAFGTRYFDVKVKTNVDFAVEVPTSAESWLKFDSYKVELDRGIRPREVTVRFNWSINSQPNERIADVVFKPKREVELARQDNLLVTQGAAEPIEENTRSGDSIALLAIARTLGTNSSWENGERMDNWDNVILWEEGMEGYTPEKKGRVKYARFFMFNTKEELPFEVQYLTAADELSFYSNVNAFLKDLTTGEYITKLTQLKRLTIAAYGLVSLDKNFTALKNLEFLDLSSNNFQKIPDEINPTNFPKLRTLLMGANTRRNIYDLSNTVETNYGGLVDEEGFPRRMIEWDLDTLQLSVNYLQGPLPKMDDWEKYTEQDIIDADTLPRALIGTPKVMPHTKRFAINLNRLTGELPRTGELTPDSVRAALGMAPRRTHAASGIVVPRPPALCQGCGHRDMYTALTEVIREEYPAGKVFSDIGCYTLGWLAPLHAIDTCVDMGASITMAKGAADAGQHPSVAVIGDSTFTHSGMTGLLDAVNERADITVIISDNLTTGMTGGQDSAGTGRLEQICAGIGVDPAHIRTVVPLPKNREEMKAVIREEIAHRGVSVIIPRRECIQTAKRHNAAKK